MKSLKFVRNVHSGAIWFVPIESFLGSKFFDFRNFFQSKGIKIIFDLFYIYKNHQLENIINEFKVDEKSKIELLNYINSEFQIIQKLSRFKNILYLLIIGLLVIFVPFVNIKVTGNQELSTSVYNEVFRFPILFLKTGLIIYYLLVFFLLFKQNFRIIIIDLIMFLSTIFLFILILGFIFIYSLNSEIISSNLVIYPTIGIIFSSFIIFIMIFELMIVKKLFKFELKEKSAVTY